MTLSPSGTQDARKIWSAVLGHLELQVTRPSFQTWLKDTVGIRVSETDIVVGTPSTFVAEMLEQRMHSLITDSVNQVLKNQLAIRFIVTSQGELTPESHSTLSTEHHKKDIQDSKKTQIPQRLISLNKKDQFDTFVSGKSNELAYAASVAVSKKPGLVYNPLTIYSDVGLGKTHLLHSIGHAAAAAGRRAGRRPRPTALVARIVRKQPPRRAQLDDPGIGVVPPARQLRGIDQTLALQPVEDRAGIVWR